MKLLVQPVMLLPAGAAGTDDADRVQLFQFPQNAFDIRPRLAGNQAGEQRVVGEIEEQRDGRVERRG